MSSPGIPSLAESSALSACVVRAEDGAAGAVDPTATGDADLVFWSPGWYADRTTLPDVRRVPGADADGRAPVDVDGCGTGVVAGGVVRGGGVGAGVLETGGDG